MNPAETYDKIDMIIFGYEIAPTTGTPHLQGYVEFSGTVGFVTAGNKLDPCEKGKQRIHLRTADADQLFNINYVTKSETKDPKMVDTEGKPVIFEWRKDGYKRTRGAGTGNAQEIWQSRLATLKDKPDILSFAAAGNAETAFKHSAGVNALAQAFTIMHMREKVEERFPLNLRLRRWQRTIATMVTTQRADDRSIFWIYDQKGCAGKSMMCTWLHIHCGALNLSNGRTTDIAHAWKGELVVTFDFTRSMEETINYSAIEALKNGNIFSPKYDSGCKLNVWPWVFVFSNKMPRLENTMTPDKWMIMDLSREPSWLELEDDPEGKLATFKIASNLPYVLADPVLSKALVWEARQPLSREPPTEGPAKWPHETRR